MIEWSKYKNILDVLSIITHVILSRSIKLLAVIFETKFAKSSIFVLVHIIRRCNNTS